LEVKGRRIPLLRNAELTEFRRRITAERKIRPDGESCLGRECYFYEVSATITGHFFSAERDEQGRLSSGYGHLGTSHLLFIEQVSGVEARRRKVPAGGVFQCSKDVWDVPEQQAKEVLARYDDCGSDSCKDALIQAFAAQHWGESSEQFKTWNRAGRDEAEESWSSPDLLKTYDFVYPDINPNIERVRTGFAIKKTTCSPTVNPLPQSAKVSCVDQDRQIGNPEDAAPAVQTAVDEGRETWRRELQKAA
jgi:hypothetical protein